MTTAELKHYADHPDLYKYRGSVFVIKYGGAAMINEDLKVSVVHDIIRLKRGGVKVVVVHGGGNEITTLAKRLGLESTFVDGQRYTDPEMMSVVQMVLAGKTNKEIVALLNRHHGNAIGLSGVDLDLLRVKQYRNNGSDIGLVGEITDVNTVYLEMLMNNNIIPVIAPIGVDEYRTVYNINADNAAARIAEHLCAAKLIYLSDIEGVIANGKVLNKINYSLAEHLIETKEIEHGMIPKIRSAFSALQNNVGSVHILDGRVKHPLFSCFTDDKSSGTELVL
jgi:acetylglutamate kinase